MRIEVYDDTNKLIGTYDGSVWDGPMEIIPKIVHCLCVSMRDRPQKAFQKAVEKLPTEDGTKTGS